ncbi:MAG TPA: YceI family protein [Burkholderiaceae bacterium]|nr:YceI family protein [Burkholderiaceae bacterium]
MAQRRRAARGLIALAAVAAAGCAALPSPPPSIAPGATAAAPAAPLPTWTLDPTHTFVHWEIVHMGTSTIRGRFAKPATGSVQFDAAAQRLEASIAVDTASVSSGVPVLDVLLKSNAALLDTATYPQATFIARDARFEGEIPRDLRGTLNLRGIDQPLTLRATRWRCALSLVLRRTVCGGDFEGEIARSAFGITHSLLFVADRVKLLVQVEAIAP